MLVRSKAGLLGILLFGLFFLMHGNGFAQVADSAQKVQISHAVSDSAKALSEAQPFSTHQPSLTGHYLKLLGITLVLLILFWFSMKYMRKLQFGSNNQKQTRIMVLSRQYLTSKHSIWLVVIGGQKYLLGVTDHAINLIDRLGAVSEQEMTEAKQMPLPSFGTLLDKLRKGKD